jgi:hypothetical protein
MPLVPLKPLNQSKETLDQSQKNKNTQSNTHTNISAQTIEIVDETQKKTKAKLAFKKTGSVSETQKQKNSDVKISDTVLQMEFDSSTVHQARLFLKQANIPESSLEQAEINADFAVDLANMLWAEKNGNYDQVLNLIDHSNTNPKNTKKNIDKTGFFNKKIVSKISPWFMNTINGQESIPDLKTIETKIMAQSDLEKKQFLSGLFDVMDSQNKRSLSSMECSNEQLHNYLNPLVNYVMTGKKVDEIAQHAPDQITQQIHQIMVMTENESAKNTMFPIETVSSGVHTNTVVIQMETVETAEGLNQQATPWLNRIKNIFKAIYQWLMLDGVFHLKHFVFRLVTHGISAFIRDVIGYWLARTAVASFTANVSNYGLFTGVASLLEGWSISFICLMSIWGVITVAASVFLVLRMKFKYKEIEANSLVGVLALLGYVGLMMLVIASMIVFIVRVALTAVIAAVANMVYLLIRNLVEVFFKYGSEKRPTVAGVSKSAASAVGIRSIQGIFSYKNSGVDYLTGENNNGLINNAILGPFLRSLANTVQAFIQDKIENHVLKNNPHQKNEIGFNKNNKTTKVVNFLESMSAQSAIYGGWFMISELLKTLFKDLGNVWGTLVQTLFYALFFGACTFFNVARLKQPDTYYI